MVMQRHFALPLKVRLLCSARAFALILGQFFRNATTHWPLLLPFPIDFSPFCLILIVTIGRVSSKHAASSLAP